jgi:hypothetical protein
LIAENEIQDAAFEPFARRTAAAISFAHLADRLVEHQQVDDVFAPEGAARF